MGFFGRLRKRLRQTDEDRLQEELRDWAEDIPGTMRIADVRLRTRVRVAGAVNRITIRPVQGFQALEVVLSDGTGEVSALWLGRRKIAGLQLGSHMVVEGVLGEQQGERRMVNPRFEFARPRS